GLYYRVCSVLFFLAFTYVFLLEKSYYLNHFYLISLLSFVMIFIPANRAFSLDARLNPSIQAGQLPGWTLWLLRFMIAVPYFFGGVAKINPDWLQGEPMRLWLSDDTDFPLIGPYFTDERMIFFLSYSGLLLDLLIVPFLLWRRTRIVAFVSITLFHLMNSQLWTIGIFPWFMIAATTIFFDPNWFRKVVQKLGSLKQYMPEFDINASMKMPSLFVRTILISFILIQLYMPFRHHLFTGYVSWNELGHRYSWHMKLRSKSGSGFYVVKDLKTNQQLNIHPKDYLSKRQTFKMKTRPDMILQFAHHLENKYKEDLQHDQIEVMAKFEAGLNGRKKQWLIDPTVDLTKITGLTPAKEWIMPLEQKDVRALK
ncbi:MAG: HTTM domain-containing protein, partial [Bacteroidota bacterium]